MLQRAIDRRQLLAAIVHPPGDFPPQLGGYVSKRAPAAVKAVMSSNGRTGKRAKATPKYQSKKNKSLKWSGRGLMPVWMREEMKGTKLTKDSFLIK